MFSGKLAWFKDAHFRVTLGISARTLIGPARWSGLTRVPGCRAGLQFRENCVYPRSSVSARVWVGCSGCAP